MYAALCLYCVLVLTGTILMLNYERKVYPIFVVLQISSVVPLWIVWQESVWPAIILTSVNVWAIWSTRKDLRKPTVG